MKFGKTFESILTTEWRQQYMNYAALKAMILEAVLKAPDANVPRDYRYIREHDMTANTETIMYYQTFERDFFEVCEQELSRVVNFSTQKHAEAIRKLDDIRIQLIEQLGPSGNLQHRKKNVRHLGLVCSEFYLSLIMLQNFQSLNFTAFRKICKKYDKYIQSERGNLWFHNNVRETLSANEDELLQMIAEVELLSTNYLANGDRAKAMAKLRVPSLRQPSPPQTVFIAGILLGLFIVSAVTVILSICYVRNQLEMLAVFTQLYRGLFGLVLCCFYLAINVYVWANVGINHKLIFNLDLRSHTPPASFLELAGGVGYICALTMILFLHHNEFGVEDPYPFPLVCLLLFVAMLLNPIRIMNFSARMWMLGCLGRVLSAPVFHVRFVDFWLAEQLNSLSLCLVDNYHLVRFYIRYYWNSNKSFDFEHDYAIAVIRCLPAWFRFAQCLRRYWDSKDRPISYPLNALKYATSIVVIILSTIVMETNDKYDGMFDNPWIWGYLIISIISTIYSTTWDLAWDFGLFQVWQGENRFLRENLLYPKWFYYFAIVANILIRCFWILELFLIYYNIFLPYNCKTIGGLLETTRRCIWNLLRLENEHLFNCGEFRATRDIFLTTMNMRDEETEMRRQKIQK